MPGRWPGIFFVLENGGLTSGIAYMYGELENLPTRHLGVVSLLH